jgi:thiamine-phosphate pyrophosphorylase
MTDTTSIYRILDANANRAREGLRTVEEFLRLARNDTDLTFRLKNLRHGVTAAIRRMNIEDELISARASDSDVGATEPVGPEAERTNPAHIVTASLRRSQEALRVLEEYSKLFSHESAADFKRIRFDTYSLEKEVRSCIEGDWNSPPSNPRE